MIYQAMMKDFLKKYWWCIIIIVFAPIVINYLLLILAIGPVVGNNIHWLAFWGSYLAALIPTIGAFMILYIQRRDSLVENEKRRKENEQNHQLQINILKYQQEMQWLNEKKNILIDFSLALSRDNLVELSNKMAYGQDILPDIKSLLADLVGKDSQIGFMMVPEQTEKFKEFNSIRKTSYKAQRDAIMDLQEINFLFHRIPLEQRYMVLVDRLQKGLVHKRLTDIIASYPSYHIFLQQNPVDIANQLIFSLPELLESTRNAALEYVKSEEERILKLIVNPE